MANLSDKETKDVEQALANGDNLPAGVFIDFSRKPPFWKPTPAERAAFFEAAGIDLKAVADADPPSNG